MHRYQMLRAYSLALTVALCGCAAPHRHSKASHTIETFTGRPDGLIRREEWLDEAGGGGCFFLATADVQSLCDNHTNQTALGGGSYIAVGPASVKVDPQTGQIIEATGSAVGNVIGAAVRKAAGVP
jgi:hypothetical protein